MPSFKRRIAHLIERVSGNIVIPPYELHRLPERLHLQRFFSCYGVDCVFDVGANLGQYARMLREEVGYRGPIVSFEPVPEIAAQLRLAAAADRNWQVEELALDREAGPATFHVAASSECSSLRRPRANQPAIFDQWTRVVGEVVVQRETVAMALAKARERFAFERPYLKLDTQGNDGAVIEGAGAALDAFVGIQTELAVRPLYEGAPGIGESLEALAARGFEPSAFVPNNARQFPMLVEVDCILYRRDAVPVTVNPKAGRDDRVG